MARALAEAGLDAVYSYAGRTRSPVEQPLPTRIGGFGGVAGLAKFLKDEAVTHVIDATHPFAAGMSRNALAASTRARVPLIALERPAWREAPGDRWLRAGDFEAAAALLPGDGSGVFLAIGRQNVGAFLGIDHAWLLRFAEVASHPLPGATLVVSRGPFTVSGDTELMRRHDIRHLVVKNSGGRAAEAKLIAARELGIRVIMVDRPALPPRRAAATPSEVMDWLHRGTERGV